MRKTRQLKHGDLRTTIPQRMEQKVEKVLAKKKEISASNGQVPQPL